MALKVEKDYFSGLDGALTDIKNKGLFPTTYATDHATAASPHWHSEDVMAYLIDGKAYFLDADGHEHWLGPGDLITVPARTLHAEGEITEPVVMLIGLAEALPMDRFLMPREPDQL